MTAVDLSTPTPPDNPSSRTTYDVEKVRASLAELESTIKAQQALVDRISDLLDEEQRDLVSLQRLLELRRVAWRELGVDV